VPSLRVSCFGKLPFYREFLRIGLGGSAAPWVIRWVESAHESWSRSGEAPVQSPLIRFAAPLDGGGLVAGTVRQSTDGLRRHPVTFFIEDARGGTQDRWHLAPLALSESWDALSALNQQTWDNVTSLSAALESGVPEPAWEPARITYEDALAAPLDVAPWNALLGETGDRARHAAANLLAVLEAQRSARSAAEGVSLAVPLRPSHGTAPVAASIWLDLLGTAAARLPVITIASEPPRLVVFFRPPEGRDLAAVLSSLDMAPIDDLGEPWQTHPSVGSDEARNLDTLAEAAPGPFKELRERIRSAVER
jgi:hypothetical protein